MPTYDYRCRKCKKTFEAFHSMSCTDPQYCPDCGGKGARILSPTSVIFKGSGFYTTEYRDSGYLEARRRDSDTGPTSTATSSPSSSSASSPTSGGPTPTPAPTAAPAAPSTPSSSGGSGSGGGSAGSPPSSPPPARSAAGAAGALARAA